MSGNQTVTTGDDVELECRYISSEAAHVSWLKHYMVNGSYFYENKVAYVRNLQVSLLHIFVDWRS